MKQREIKFRAWDIKRQKMISPEGVLMLPKREGGGQAISGAGNNYELMQFTGLKDRDGKEIYEGDVLSYDGVHGEAMFYEGAFVLHWNHTHWPLFQRIGSWKVVGNIFDNPELLRKIET